MPSVTVRGVPRTLPPPQTARAGHAFGSLVTGAAALTTAGAGIVHLDAAGDHSDHTLVATFFVAAAVAQLWWAGSALGRTTSRWTLATGLVLNGALVALWGVSRTIGLPDIGDGVGGVEALGWSDAVAAGLELTSMAVGGVALAMPAAAAMAAVSAGTGARVLRGAAAATLAITVPAVVAPHAHGEQGHGAAHGGQAAHAHGDDADLAAGGAHADGDAPHSDDGAHEVDHALLDPLDVHAEVIPGRPAHHDDGHADASGAARPAAVAGATHEHGVADPHGDAGSAGSAGSVGAHHTAAHHDATAPVAADPLDGPGRVSTLRLGPIPLLPTIDGVQTPHLSAAIPFVGPGRVNLLPLTGLPAPCQDCYVLGIQPDLVYADGAPANLDTGPMLHHAVFTDHSRDDPVCGRDTLLGQMGLRVFAAGNERTGGVLPPGFGVPLERGPWGGILELMNMSDQVRTVFVELAVRWVPRTTPGIAPVTPVWLDVDSCGDSEVDVPAGVSDVVWEWPSKLTGRIVAAGGHLHDGGVWLGLTNATTGEHVCTSVAGYGTRPAFLGSLESMSTCAWDRLGKVRAGERLRLTAHYNTSRATPGVMGIMLAFVHETDDLDAGAPSPYPSEPPPDDAPVDGGHEH